MPIIKTVTALRLLLAATVVAAAPPPQAAKPKEVTFTIVHTQDGSCSTEGWLSRVSAHYRLCSMWPQTFSPSADVQRVLREQGMTADMMRVAFGIGTSPRSLFELRGSLLGLKPGERLQFYIDKQEGTANEKHNGEHATVATVGDGLFEVRTSRQKETDRPDPLGPGTHVDAEFIRSPKGGVLLFYDNGVPGAGLSDFFGCVLFGTHFKDQSETWLKLFYFTFTNEELGTWSETRRTNHVAVKNDEGDALDYKADLSIVPPRPDVPEVTVLAEAGYPKWIPEGNLERSTEPGNSLLVRIKVHKADDPTTPRRAKLSFTLPYTSEQKGVCMNWPAVGPMNVGLRFRKEDFAAGGPLVFSGDKHVESREAVEQAEIRVHAYDFGAHGTLRITATDDAGQQATVTVEGQAGPDLSIPRDDNHNRVADAWEDKYKLAGAKADLDEDDKPAVADDASRGDGLTLYEEYRGFRVNGVYVRTDPTHKDLFVCDKTKGFVAQAGTEYFASITGITVHHVRPEELVTEGTMNNYVINRNSAPETHVVDQHGVLIVDGPAGSDPEAVAAFGHGRIGPPRFTKYIQLPPGRNFDTGDGMADVAHELCHAVGVQHHGDDGILSRFWTWAESGGRWQLYEQEVYRDAADKLVWKPGKIPIQVLFEDTGRDFRHGDALPAHFVYNTPHDGWLLYLGTKNGEFSGDQECLLRYADKQAYVSETEPNRVRYIPDEKEWKMRNRLCATAAGTGVNASSHGPQSRYGTAAAGRGDCKDQIKVSDKYGSK